MEYDPSGRELAHFPFLKKANDRIKNLPPLEVLLKDERGSLITMLAVKRINQALSSKKTIISHFQNRDEDEIASYVLSRVIASCIGDAQLIDRLTRYEAERAYQFLVSETGTEDGEKGWNENVAPDADEFSKVSKYLAHEFGIDITQERMALSDYVEIVAQLHEHRFKLVNRVVHRGFVGIRQEERYELLRERIRVILRRELPYRNVPKSLCGLLAPYAEQIKKEYQEKMMQNFGAVEEGSFPPCIQALLNAITSGGNLTHPGRFSLTAFLHNIGMEKLQIAELFARAPDFDAEKTMYQVGHITGGGGTEYSAPACAAMRTTGLCIHPDPLCEKINHPLSYYKIKKKKGRAAPAGQPVPDHKTRT
jgi:DNA primase large subunit